MKYHGAVLLPCFFELYFEGVETDFQDIFSTLKNDMETKECEMAVSHTISHFALKTRTGQG